MVNLKKKKNLHVQYCLKLWSEKPISHEFSDWGGKKNSSFPNHLNFSKAQFLPDMPQQSGQQSKDEVIKVKWPETSKSYIHQHKPMQSQHTNYKSIWQVAEKVGNCAYHNLHTNPKYALIVWANLWVKMARTNIAHITLCLKAVFFWDVIRGDNSVMPSQPALPLPSELQQITLHLRVIRVLSAVLGQQGGGECDWRSKGSNSQNPSTAMQVISNTIPEMAVIIGLGTEPQRTLVHSVYSYWSL